jgi:hypothetical protein
MDDLNPDKEKMLLGKPSVIEDIEIDFGHEDTKVNRGGMVGVPKNRKKLTSVFKDQMSEQFERRMKKDFQYVLTTVVEEARDGNMTAAKLLFDRVIPTNKAIDQSQLSKIPMININIGSLEEPEVEPSEVISEQ